MIFISRVVGRLAQYAGVIVRWLILTAIFFVACEYIARTVLSLTGKKNRSSFYSIEESSAYKSFPWKRDFLKEMSRHFRAMGTAKAYDAYSLWKEFPAVGEYFNVTAEGYRNTLQPETAQGGPAVQVYVFGGSTLFGAQVPDRYTIPSFLAHKLQSCSGKRSFSVSNYGIDGFVSEQEMNLLLKLLSKGRAPKIVIFYDGANDIFNKVLAGVPHTFYEKFQGAVNRKAQFRETLLAFAQRLTLVQLLSPSSKNLGIPDVMVLQERAAEMAQHYAWLTRTVSAIIGDQTSGRAYFMWQPTITSTGKVLSEEEERIKNELPPATKAAFEQGDRAVSELIGNHQGRLFDLRGSLDGIKEGVFLDFCHVSPIANERIAEQMARSICDEE
jgi:hypothetical protein